MAEDAAELGSRKDPQKIEKPTGTATTVGFSIQSLFDSPSNRF